MTRYSKTWLPVILFVCAVSALKAQPGHSILRDTFCGNQSIFVGNQIFGPSNPTGQVVLPGGAFNGIDSVIHVELVFRQPVTTNLTGEYCEGDTVWVNGTPYHYNFFIGQEVIQEGAANGCDSIVNVNLKFHKVFSDYQAVVCDGDTIFVNGTAYSAFHPEGVEVIPNGFCDSIVRVKLTILVPPTTSLKDTLCPDGFYLVNGVRYDYNNRAGFEVLPNASAVGCDSVVFIDLKFRNLWLYIGEDREMIKGDTLCITPQYGLTPVNFVWLPTAPCADSACIDKCIRVTEPTVFTLLATDTSGCVLRDDIRLTISNKNHVYAPNVFSPSSHWPNNFFYLNCDHAVVNIKRMFIADRWGELIFDKTNLMPNKPDDGWDGMYKGQLATPDTYIFWAELERYDGTTFFEKGGVSLIR